MLLTQRENISDFVINIVALAQTLTIISKIFEIKLLRCCQPDLSHCTLWLTHIEKSPSNPWKRRKEELPQKSM